MAKEHQVREALDVDLNVASEQEIAAIPMIGPERAKDIMGARPIRSWEALALVPGFDEQLVARLQDAGVVI